MILIKLLTFRTSKIYQSAVICLLSFCPYSMPLFAEAVVSEPILVGVEVGYPPYSMVDGNGQPMGFAVELMEEALKIMNQEYSFVVDTWENVKKALAEGSIQALPLVGRTPEREAIFDFTFPYLTRYGTIVVRDDSPVPEKYEDIRGLRVGVMKGDNAEEYVRRNPVPVEIVTAETFEEVLLLLSEGEIDAVVIQRLLALQLQKQYGFKNLTIGSLILEDNKQSFCFAVTEGNRELLGVLNEGLALVMANGTFDRLQSKWFAQTENARVRDNRLIVGGDEAYPPYEYLDEDGKPAGYNVELTRAIAQRMGLEVEIRLGPWNEIYQGLLKGEIDVIQGLFYSSERDRILAFSQPHTLVNHVIVTRKDGPQFENLSEIKDASVLIMRGDITHEFLIGEGLESNLILTTSQEEALKRLSNGEGDCAIIAQIPAYYWIEKDKISNLSVGTKSLLDGEYNFGALEENYRFLLPFTQGLSALKATGEYHAIASNWLGVYESRIGVTKENLKKVLIFIFLPLLIVFIIIVVWSVTLKRLVKSRTLELQNSEERYRTLFETVEDAIFIYEPVTFKIQEANEATSRIYGYSKTELIGMSSLQLSAEVEASKKTGEQIIESGYAEVPVRHHRNKAGEELYIHLSGYKTRVKDQDMVFAVCRDISSQIKAEKEQEKLQEQLNHSQKLEAVGQLAGGIAHDFNNQLTGIIGYAEMLKPGIDDDSLRRYAENIRLGAKNSARLTKQLLSFARKGQYTLSSIDLHGIIDEVINILVHTVDKRIQIKQKRNTVNPTIKGDRTQIQNALLNIALNARDAITGSGTITFESAVITIDENYSGHLFHIQPGEYVCISIRDDGVGIDEGIQRQIFEPFFTTKEMGRGTGMGLSAAYGTVKHHGGDIFLESRLHVGSTFHVLLPYEVMEKAEEPEEATFPLATCTTKILIIDDDDIIRSLNAELLESLGYQVHGDGDGKSGLEYYQEHLDEIGLLILDMVMPAMSGEDVFYAIKQINPRAKIIISSGYTTADETISKIVRQGVPYLQKPCSLSELSELVAITLKRD